jgi:hypothetical protein
LYGRFPFPAIDEFIARLQLISDKVLAPATFNSYVTTYGRESFYGLDYRELQETFVAHSGEVRTITTSAAGPANRSVNVSVRFGKDGKDGEGQYIIVTPTTFENNEVRRMVMGEWTAPDPDRDVRDQQIASIISNLIRFRARQDAEQKQAMAEAAATSMASMAAAEDASPERRALSTIRDTFRFEDSLPAETILQLLDTLSQDYLDGVPFHIRMITTDGEPYANIGLTGLRRVLEKRRNLVLKVFADATSPTGETVELTLGFGPMSRKQNAEIEIISRYSREMRAVIREALEDSVEYIMPSASMVHEMFWFDQTDFTLNRCIRLVQRLGEAYFDQETPTAFLSTTEGKTYPALTLKQLLKVYQQYEDRISFLLFGINQTLTGQTFSLMFQFRSVEHEPYGSLSMMWGSEEIHRAVRADIWRELGLKRYHGQPQRKMAPGPSPSPSGAGNAQDLMVRPSFSGRGFTMQPRTCLVVMPLEAYWSDALWMHLQQTLRSVGWDSYRAGALYAQNILDDTWQALNEVEVVLFDLTYKHPDVFYKIGMAHTLGKKIILITQHARDLPPDFQRFAHVVYDNNIHGLQRLSERVIDLLKVK